MIHAATLLELALAEQEARNCAALVAIRARGDDIGETQRLVEALGARGVKVRAVIDTVPIGASAQCRIQLWLSSTRAEFQEVRDWLTASDIPVTRLAYTDIGDVCGYEITLRGQKLRLNVATHDPAPARFRYVRTTPDPEAA